MNDRFDPSLAEIRKLLDALPPWGDAPDGAGGSVSFGLLDSLAAWLGAGQGRGMARLERPRAAVFLGNWGGDDAGDRGSAGAARAALDALRSGRARLNGLCRFHDAELRVYEMAVEEPAAGAQGLTETECATAMAYGMMAVEDGLDLLCLAASGPGVNRAAAALSDAVAGRQGGAAADPLAALALHGGHALCALAGAVIAARMARVPVVFDGFAAVAAGAALSCVNGAALDHCVLAQQLDDGAPRRLQDALGKAAVLDLGIVSEDGSAALLVLGLLRSALASSPETPG